MEGKGLLVKKGALIDASAHRDRRGSGLVRGVELTPANVEDTDVADALIMGDGGGGLRGQGV